MGGGDLSVVHIPGETVLFAQGQAPAAIRSLAAGGNAAGFGVVLWSHTGAAYPITPVAWDTAAGTGLQADPDGAMMAVSPALPGSTMAQVSRDGSLVGVVIDSNDLLAGGSVPYGPLALTPVWTPAAPPVPFSGPAAQGLLLRADLEVPYVLAPRGGTGASVSQIVLYFALHDNAGGRDLSYGQTVFDSRGTSSPYFGIDNGAGGTGSVVVTAPAGAASPYDVVVPGAAGFQAVPWSGFRTFAFLVTPGTLLGAVNAANRRDPGARLSTNPADYSISNVSVDAEIAYFGQRNILAYAVRNFTVSTVADAGQVAIAPSSAASEVWAGGRPETIHAAAGSHYVVHAGAGALNFIGNHGSSTVVGGAGTTMASAGPGRLVAFGGSGDTILFGGNGDNQLNAGSGNTTLVGGGGDLLCAGSGNSTIFVAAGSNTITGGAASGSVTISATDGTDLIALGAGRQTVFLGSGHATLFGTSSAGANAVVIAQDSDALLIGGKGHDAFWGGSGRSTMVGGAGDAVMVGGTGNTVIVGGTGRNLIMAGHGHDTVFGGMAGDTIYTGPGNALVVLSQASAAPDLIALGSGDASVFGGGSADTYFLKRGAGGGENLVSGFRPGTDRLSLAGFDKARVFEGLQQTAAGARLSLDDGTRITFLAVSDMRGSIFA